MLKHNKKGSWKRGSERGSTGTISLRTSSDAFATTVATAQTLGAADKVAVPLSFDTSKLPATTAPLEVRLYMHDLKFPEGTSPGKEWACLRSTKDGGDGLRVSGDVVP